MATLPLELLQWLYKVLLNEYKDPKKTYQDVCLTLINYPIFKARTRIYTNQTGQQQLLLNLYGTIDTPEIQLPVDIWFPLDYPHVAPIVYVLHDERYVIKPTNHVQLDGLVFHPFLYEWNLYRDDETNKFFKILKLMQLLGELLRSDVPCIFKPRTHHQQLPSSPLTHNPVLPQRTASPLAPQLPPKPRSMTQTPVPVQREAGTPVESPTPPVYKEFESLSLMDQDASSSDLPRLPPNPTRQELLDTMTSNLSKIANSIDGTNFELSKGIHASSQNITQLQNELLQIEQEQLNLDDKISQNHVILDNKIQQVIKLNQTLREKPELNLDDLVAAPTVQLQQLYELVTKDKAISDSIQLLMKLYELEKLQLPQMMKFVRNLARDQFLCRALIKKIVAKLQLDIEPPT